MPTMIRKLLQFVYSFLFYPKSISKKPFVPHLKLICLMMFFFISIANAANRYSVANGNWNSTATWSASSGGASGASVPVAGDVVYIEGHSIVVTANAACSSITFSGNTNTLTVNAGFVLTVASGGAIIHESSASSSRILNLAGAGTINCTSITAGSNVNPNSLIGTTINSTISNLNVSGNLTLDSRRSGANLCNATFNLQSGILDLGGQIISTNEHANNNSTFSNATGAQSGTLLLSSATPFNLSGTGTTTITLNGTSSLVNYDRGGNQAVYGTNYNNLTISGGSGTKTLGGAIAVNGNLDIQGGATLATSNNAVTLRGNFTNGGGFTAGSSPITIDGTSNQNISGFTTTGLVSMTKTGGTATLTGNVSSTNTALTINGSGGTLNLGTGLSHTFSSVTLSSGNLNGGSSIINLSATNPFTGSTSNFAPATGTVNLNGARAQNTLLANFYNLTLSGGNFVKTFSTTTNIGNILSIATNTTANLQTFTHNAVALILGTSTRTSGVYGGNTSTGTTIVSGSFATATGKVVISTDSCVSFAGVAPITQVSLNTLVYPTTATTAYEDIPKTTATTTVNKGDYYSLVISGNTNGDQNMYYTAFFDWNGDGSFGAGEGPYQLGTIRNSSGSDGKVTSRYIQILSTATGTDIKMRIIGLSGSYNSTSCTTNTGTGQVEDYVITLQSGCTGTLPASVTTSSTSTSVCPDAPFTLSLGSTFGDGATYKWQTSPDGNNPWTDAATPSIPFFSSDFATAQAINTTVGQIALRGVDTEIKGGELILTDIVEGGHNGGFLIDKSNTDNINPFTATFKYRIWDGGTVGADGLSLSYGPGFAANEGGGESGESSGLRIQFDTYDNEGVATGSRVRILYNNVSIFNAGIDDPLNLRTSIYRDVRLNVDSNGMLTLAVQNSSGTMITVVSKLLLPNYTTTNKSTWKFKFSARTGGSKDKHSLDDVTITFLDSENSKSTFTTSQTIKTYYRAVITCGGSSVNSNPVLVDMTSAVITTQPIAPTAVCSGNGVRTISVAATGSSLTYAWRYNGNPIANGGVFSGATTNTLTITNPLVANAGNYSVVVTGACPSTATSNAVALTVNALPTPTFTAQPSAPICVDTDVTYTTQSGMTNYVWGFPGVLNTNYSIISGGGTNDNTVTLRYLTAGSKTVTINYTNGNGCTATAATSSNALTVNALPVITTQPQALALCEGENGNFTIATSATSPTYQ